MEVETESEPKESEITTTDATGATEPAPVPEFIVLDEKTTKEYTGSALDVDQYVQIKIGRISASLTDSAAYYTYQWQKQGADSNYADMGTGEAPINAGNYQLVLTPTESAKDAGAVGDKILFTITPAKLVLEAEPINVNPGASKSDVESTEVAFKIADASSNAAKAMAESQGIKNLITATIKKDSLANSMTGQAVTGSDAEHLKRSDEYVVDVEATFTPGDSESDKAKTANYKLSDEDQNKVTLKVNVKALELVKTELKYTPKTPAATDTWSWENEGTEEEPKWVLNLMAYTPNSAAENLVADSASKYFDIEVQKADTDPAEKVTLDPAVDKIEGEWVQWADDTYLNWDGDEISNWPEKSWQPTEAPVHAGTYFYRVTFSSTGDIYDKDDVIIKVIIKPAQIVIQPKAKGTPAFSEHMTVKDVLAQFDYDVYDVVDGIVPENASAKSIDRDHFWGTSYDDSGATQPYEPVLCLEVSPKDKDEWKDCPAVDENGHDTTLSLNNKYRVIFSGYKAVYNADGPMSNNADGTPAHMVDINTNPTIGGPEPDYAVNTQLDWAKKAYVIENSAITPAIAVKINTDFAAEKGGASLVKDATPHVYSVNDPANAPELPLFTSRDQYKKAQLESVANAADKYLTGQDSAFTYTWSVGEYKDNDEYVYENGYTGGFVDLIDLELWNANKATETTDPDAAVDTFEEHVNWVPITDEKPDNMLYRAGIYRLAIHYDNSVEGYYAAENTVYVYYVINQRKLKVELTAPTGDNALKVMSETTIGDFLEEIRYDYDRIEKKIMNVTDPANPKHLENWEEGPSKDYTVVWKIVETRPSAEDPTTTEEEAFYKGSSHRFSADAGYSYALKVAELKFNNNQECSSYRSDPRNNTAYDLKAELADPEDTTSTTKVRTADFLSKDQSLPVAVEKMAETELVIVLNPDKLANKSKIYDGQVFHIEGDAEENQYGFTTDFVSALDNGLITFKTKAGADVTDLDPKTDLLYQYYDEDGYPVDDFLAKHVGKYKLMASYKGDTEKYHSCAPTEVATVEITKRDLNIDASKVLGDVTAGTRASSVNGQINYRELVIDNPAPSDADDFQFDGSRFDAWGKSNPVLEVYEKDAPYYNIIKSNGNYYLEFVGQFPSVSSGSHDQFARDYKVNYTPVSVNVVRGYSTVSVYSVNEEDEDKNLKAYDDRVAQAPETKEKNWLHTVSIREGVDYVTRYTGIQGEILDGNLVRVSIKAPNEYGEVPKTAVYESQLEAQGGKGVDASSAYITVIFNAKEGTKEFDISWETGYTEHFKLDFADADAKGLLLPNLHDAVVPKSLAFNAPNKKMVVGQTQQLDVKLSKKQVNDVICLEYAIADDKTVLSVDKETGLVTALKTGSATVEVYPVHLVKGVKTKFDESAKAKSAKVKITVTDVAAPKITKVTPLDTSATVEYAEVPAGYRREVYVRELLPGEEKIKAEELERKVQAIQNENWKADFAIAPQYFDSADEYLLKHNFLFSKPVVMLEDLKPETSYAVYVRNVSGIRTLNNDDRSEVVFSAKGSVKIFKTTKLQIKSLRMPYDFDSVCDQVYSPRISLKKENREEDHSKTDDYEELYFSVSLSDKSAYVITDGLFADYNNWADEDDEQWIAVPMGKNDPNAAYYANPKLSYAVYDSSAEKYVQKTDLISIDKNGKITFKGIGRFTIRVKDENSCTCWKEGHGYNCDEHEFCECEKCAYLTLEVTANITNIAPKKAKTQLEVGESVNLGELLNYKDGNKVVKGYNNYAVYADEALKTAVKNDGCFTLNEAGDTITAVKAGGNLAGIILQDDNVKDASATLSLTSKALTPVKGFKINNVIDDRVQLEFLKHEYTTAKNSSGLGYRIEVKDTRGVTKNTLVWESSFDPLDEEDDYNYRNDTRSYRKLNQKDKKWHYYYNLTGLTKQSQYTISVYTVWRDQVSQKPASKKVKTTNIAAADTYCQDDKTRDPGGIPVVISEFRDLSEDATFTSGNAYTLTANPATLTGYGNDRANKSRLTDSLTWSSTNTKVATVKAGGGSFSATLKAVKPGTATIEVKSKIWKGKTIGRYTVQVCAVGDAYRSTNRYFDVDEEDPKEDSSDPSAAEDIRLPLSVDAPRKVSVGKEQDFSFKVPVTGRYKFSTIGHVNATFDFETPIGNATNRSNVLEEGTVVELSSYVSRNRYYYYPDITAYHVLVTCVESIAKLTGNELKISADSDTYRTLFSFTADEDGYYKFQALGEDGSAYPITFYDSVNNINSGPSKDSIGNSVYLDKDQTVYGYVYNNYSAGTLTVKKNSAIDPTNGANVTFAPYDSEFLVFNVTNGGIYQFYSEGTESNDIEAYIVDPSSNNELESSNPGENGGFMLDSHAAKQGSKIYVRVYNNSYKEEAFTVKVKLTAEVKTLTEDGASASFSLANGKEGYIIFKAPETGYYDFASAGLEAVENAFAKGELEDENGNRLCDGEADDKGNFSIRYGLQEGEEVTLKITVTNEASEDAVPFSVSVKKAAMLELAVDEDPSNTSIAAKKDAIWSFTAPETAFYEFTMVNADPVATALYASIRDPYASIETGADTNAQIIHKVNEGDTVYIIAENSSDKDVTAGIKVSKTELAEAAGSSSTMSTTISENSVEYIKLPYNNTGIVRFTATADGMYTFNYKTTVSSSLSLYEDYLYGSLIKEESGSSIKLSQFLKAGQPVWLVIESTYRARTITLSVEKEQLGALTLDTAMSVNLNPNDSTWYTFTTGEEAKEYELCYSPTTYSLTLELYRGTEREYNSDSGYRYDGSENNTQYYYYAYHLESNQEYYLKVSNKYSTSYQGNIWMQEKPEIPELLEGTPSATRNVAANKYVTWSFTPSNAGYYEFSMRNGEGVSLNIYSDAYYIGSTYDIQVGTDGEENGKAILYLQAGNPVYAVAKNSSEANIEVALTVNSMGTTVFSNISVDESKHIKANTSDKTLVSFTADEDDIYTFNCKVDSEYSYASVTASLYVKKPEGNSTVAEVSREDKDINISYPIKAGATVYLQISSSYSYPFTLHASREKTVESLTLDGKKEVEISSLKDNLFKIAGLDAGKYKIFCDNNNWIGTLYEGFGSKIDSTKDMDNTEGKYCYSYTLAAGQEYFLNVSSNSSALQSVEVWIQKVTEETTP